MSVAVSEDQASGVTINRLTDIAAAEVRGIDLANPMDTAMRDRLWQAFLEHHVLVFRDQDLTTEQQHAFSLNWGELEHHVIRLADGKPAPVVQMINNLDADGKPTERPFSSGNYHWHTDKSYHEVPSLLTMLHAVTLPPKGGDTEFANTALAYDALSDDTKAEIEGLTAVHSWEASRQNTRQRPATPDEIAERPRVTHPLVRTHPDTGAKALYVGCHVSHIEAPDEKRAKSLLRELNAHATQRKFIYAHEWQPGDLVMWDNRTLLHRAVANYEMGAYPRILHRTVVRGTVPF